MSKEITNVYELRDAYWEMNPGGHFFDKKTLKAFGERLSDMRLLKGVIKITDPLGEKHTCYVLSSIQRIPLVGKKRIHHFFDIDTFEDVDFKMF